MPMLIACESCHRQYDVGDFRPGAKIRCVCGAVRTVPKVRPRQVRMLHCSDCGGALEPGRSTCAWCDAAVDANALRGGEVCPECYAALATGAKFCNDCGVAIEPVSVLRAVSDHGCPVCREPLVLTETDEHRYYQCTSCLGVWLDRERFEEFCSEHEARAEPLPEPLPGRAPAASPGLSRAELHEKLGGANLRCPVCKRILLRKAFANTRSVVIDECKAHGFWFDEGELNEIGALIESGWLRELQRRHARSRALRRRRRLRRRAERRRASGGDDLLEMLLVLALGL